MRHSPSNPLISAYSQRGLQVAEPLLWLKPTDYTVQAVCGRCTAVPAYWHTHFTWGANNETISTPFLGLSDLTVPRVEWQYLFHNVQLKRYLISRYIPRIDILGLLAGGPSLRYTRCHYRAPPIGPTIRPHPEGPIQLTPIPNTQWYLWYGDSFGSDLESPQQPNQNVRLTDHYISNTVLRQPLPFDSYAEGVGDEFDSPITYQGWILALVRSHTFSIEPTSPERVIFSPYALYHLKQPPLGQAERRAVFLSFESNVFTIVHNPLHLPPHTIRLSPENI